MAMAQDLVLLRLYRQGRYKDLADKDKNERQSDLDKKDDPIMDGTVSDDGNTHRMIAIRNLIIRIWTAGQTMMDLTKTWIMMTMRILKTSIRMKGAQ